MASRRSMAGVVILVLGCSAIALGGEAAYRSPFDVAFSPDGKLLAVSDRTASSVAFVDPGRAKVLREVELHGSPTGVAWASSGDRLFVAEYGAGSVAEVAPDSGTVLRRLGVGLRPVGVAVANRRKLLVVANTVTDDVSIVDLETGKEKRRVPVPREPYFVAVTPDETVAIAGNLLPAGSPADPTLSAAVSLIDLECLETAADVRLPPGSTSIRQIAVSRDGRWAYAAHTLGRFNVPATQLDRGWVNTNALSLIDLSRRELFATVLLDHPFEGAADPWGIALTAEGRTLWITLAGVHRLARIDLEKLHRLTAEGTPVTAAPTASYAASTRSVWAEIRIDPQRRRLLVNDLSALHVAGVIELLPLEAAGPRGIAASPDGSRLAVAAYYSGTVVLVDAASGKPSAAMALGAERPVDAVRRGEMLFHDATICFQKWMSCATCHPDSGRTDGLRWDLLNDGLGTPQRTRSLLLSHKFRPTTARGVRAGLEESVDRGLFFFLHKPDPALAEPLIAYLKSLQPEPSPHLVKGELSGSAARGKSLFDGKADCSGCHKGALGSDLKAHDVGTRSENDRPEDLFYTPKLVELYRTAPFLHDGRAATLAEVLTVHNTKDRHGNVSKLTPEELKDLEEYLRSR